MTTGRPARLRDERGVAAPSPLVMLSVVAVAMAGLAFIATQDDDGERELQTVSEAAPSPTASETTEPETTDTTEAETTEPRAPLPKKKPKAPAVQRSETLVEVYNNSGIRGLAGQAAGEAAVQGWQVVGSDNWVGTIPAPTIYYGPRLERAATLLAKDLGITRLRPAVDPMRPDRLTVILTADYA